MESGDMSDMTKGDMTKGDMSDMTKEQETLLQVILANTSSAMKISNTLCEHSDDKVLKADEIICGLIYRLMVPMTDEEMQSSLQEAETLMYDDDDDEEGDEEYDDEEYDEEDKDIIRKVRVNNCNCDICSKVRVCLLNFNDYLPKDELGDKFKSSILETCKTHNRLL